jgi:hypothetical protein
VQKLLNNAVKTAHQNKSSIYAAIAIGGVASTAYLASKASIKASKIISEHKKDNGEIEEPLEKVKVYTPLVWKLYIPTAASAATTVGCILMANKVNAQKTAAAISAYTLTEKVVDQIGANKEQKIRDEITEDALKKTTLKDSLILPGSGDILCCEMYTRRYFMSDMETLRKAQNDVNMAIFDEIYVTLDYFYSLIGLSTTSHSNELGWDSDRLLDLEFSTTLTEDGRPCLTFCYNYLKPI